jgi:hypothetical protein
VRQLLLRADGRGNNRLRQSIGAFVMGRMCRGWVAEDGIALITALGVMIVLTVLCTATFSYAQSNQASARMSSGRQAAGAMAEAGINAAFNVLSKPSNNALTATLLPACTGTADCDKITDGSSYALFGGTLALDPVSKVATWTLVSTGYVLTNGAATYATHSLKAIATITPTLTQPANNPAWNYIYAFHPATPGVCDEIIQQSVTVASPFFVKGNLCLQNTATIVSGPLDVSGSLTLQQKANGVGTPSNPISDAHIADGCQYWNKAADLPCKGNADNVYAKVLDTTPVPIPQPMPAWDTWYQNGSPGPNFPCESSSGTVPLFDTSPPDGRNNTYGAAPFNLTPAISYTCKNVNGELSWNAATHVLTVSGTIFIDGSAYINNGAVNTYTGQATLYLSGTFLLKNSKLCAGVNAGGTSCDTAGWDPNTTLLGIITNGSGGQVNSWDGVQLVSAMYQGALFASADIDTDTTSNADGPLCASAVNLGQSANTSFPAITILPIGMPGGFAIYAQPDNLIYIRG